ncbi:CHAT domain-containing protein [Streptomyces sp. NPDC006446]|uniref:CHAT domain-containing protein n=1 Tax=Streptomyces sp. NPDC006446 TaxID=3154301 RepID=UPI0033A4A359
MRVHSRSPRRGSHDLDALGRDDRVEGLGVLPIPVTEQDTQRRSPRTAFDGEVPRPGRRRSVGLARALRLHSFGSLARNALRAGLGAVVAMRYDVYVSTAADFVSSLYERLVGGAELAEAVTLARRDLAASDAAHPRTDEWLVPVIYQGRHVRLFDAPPGATDEAPAPRPPAEATHESDTPLPAPPEIVQVGGDDITITLDRAFDQTTTVLMRGPVGAGKTTAAADFAR